MVKVIIGGVARDATAQELADLVASTTITEEERLNTKRTAANLKKTTFLNIVASPPFEIISWESAVIAAEGGWPTEFSAFLGAFTAVEQAQIRIKWAGETLIWYTDTTLSQIALAQTGGDQAAATTLLDAIFGIS